MTDERPLSFIDTNVLVYAFNKSRSTKQQIAQQLMTELMDEDRLRLSTQILQEPFVSQRCSIQEALAVREDLRSWPGTLIDFAAIQAAVSVTEQAKLSFWDALVVVAAMQSGAKVLYTEDLNDGQELLGVRITNPFSLDRE
jgi:predicted nucleic acid-binding protein